MIQTWDVQLLRNIVYHPIGPIKQLPRRIPIVFAEEEKKDIDLWASPIVMFRKKIGKLRFCVDYRRLNNVTESDVFPLSRIEDCLDSVEGAEPFSTFDLTSGYLQITV